MTSSPTTSGKSDCLIRWHKCLFDIPQERESRLHINNIGPSVGVKIQGGQILDKLKRVCLQLQRWVVEAMHCAAWRLQVVAAQRLSRDSEASWVRQSGRTGSEWTPLPSGTQSLNVWPWRKLPAGRLGFHPDESEARRQTGQKLRTPLLPTPFFSLWLAMTFFQQGFSPIQVDATTEDLTHFAPRRLTCMISECTRQASVPLSTRRTTSTFNPQLFHNPTCLPL